MTAIRFSALPTDITTAYQNGELDANAQAPRRYTSKADKLPCRHCMAMVTQGEVILELAHRPFPEPQPYAEVGPIFLHAEGCERGGDSAEIPPFLDSPSYIVRGYTANNRIYYGSGGVIPTEQIPSRAKDLFSNDKIAYLHIRSAANNCYHCRIDRA